MKILSASKAKGYQYQKLASDPNITVDTLWELSDSSDVYVRYAVATNPSTPNKLLKKLSDDIDSLVYCGVATNPNTPSKVLEHMYKSHPYAKVMYKMLAKNPNTPAKVLSELIQVSDKDIRLGVVNNPNTPNEILEKLSNDRYSIVRNAAHDIIAIQGGYNPMKIYSNTAITIDDTRCYDLITPVTLNSKIFNLDDVYFLDDVFYGNVDDNDYYAEFKRFGAIAEGNDWIIPKNLKFTIKNATDRYLFIAERNGVELEFTHLDGTSLHIELTSLGNKCLSIAEKTRRSFEDVVAEQLGI